MSVCVCKSVCERKCVRETERVCACVCVLCVCGVLIYIYIYLFKKINNNKKTPLPRTNCLDSLLPQNTLFGQDYRRVLLLFFCFSQMQVPCE